MQHPHPTLGTHLRRRTLAIGALALTACLLAAGCGSEDTEHSAGKADKDHVFKGQKEALDSARGVAGQLQDAAKRKKDSE